MEKSKEIKYTVQNSKKLVLNLMNVFLLHRYLIRINAHLDILWKTLDQILLSWIFIYFNLKVGLGKAKWLEYAVRSYGRKRRWIRKFHSLDYILLT